MDQRTRIDYSQINQTSLPLATHGTAGLPRVPPSEDTFSPGGPYSPLYILLARPRRLFYKPGLETSVSLTETFASITAQVTNELLTAAHRDQVGKIGE